MFKDRLNMLHTFAILYIIIHLHSVQAQTTERAVIVMTNATDVIIEVPNRTRSFNCFPILRLFNLDLRQPLRAGEQIGLTGSHDRLGAWRVERSLDMKRRDSQGLKWYLRMLLCTGDRVYYRYFVFKRDERGNKRIQRWEGHQHPRVLKSHAIVRQMESDVFGEVYRDWLLAVEQERGWLRCEYMIEFKFIWRRHFKFNQRPVASMLNGTRMVQYRLQLLVLTDDAQNIADTEVEVVRYAYNHSHFYPQQKTGVSYVPGDIVIFRVVTPLRVQHTYELQISSCAGEHIGTATIMPMDLQRGGSSGILQVPIHGADSGFVGYLTLPYLLVQPLPTASVLNLRGSFQHYWPLNWPTMDVGHRGLGSSFYRARARYTENTIESLLAAHNMGADMVELDVQLTRDYVPVLWHESGFFTAPYGRRVLSRNDLHYVLIQSIAYAKLKSRRVFVSQHGEYVEYTQLNVRRRDVLGRIFPALEEVYERVPKTLGLIVQIYWPQPLTFSKQNRGRPRQFKPLDKNQYVDRLLDSALRIGCGRALIFSSLDADICTLFRHKQNIFPALFQVSGSSTVWQPYLDLRTVSAREAVNFAQSEQLLGTAPHAADMLTTRSLQNIQLGLQIRQAVFVWGRELQRSRQMERFRWADASALIYDQLDRFISQRKRHSFFDAPELLELYARQCQTALGNRTLSEQVDSCKFNRHVKLERG